MAVSTWNPGARWRRLLGDPVDRNLQPFEAALRAVNALSGVMAGADDRQLRASAVRLREHARQGAPDADLLVETFALVREVAFRMLGQRPFDVQILAGLAMHAGRVVEMQTGEGKTLAAVAPAALGAWSRRGVHVLTVNDYLASRDAGWMGPIYEFLGLRTGAVQQDTSSGGRRDAYRCDVTYVTAKEAGFDFLRDRLRMEPDEQVQRAFHLAIVDEADSILVDEARVPLVIAGEAVEQGGDLARIAAAVRRLDAGIDYDTDEHARNVNLTATGSERLERLIGCANLYAPAQLALLALVRAALHAQTLLRRDVDYIVRDGRVELVDELTGRVVLERQWPDGLQAAIEAKEGLAPRPEGRILGSITMQHFISAYPQTRG